MRLSRKPFDGYDATQASAACNPKRRQVPLPSPAEGGKVRWRRPHKPIGTAAHQAGHHTETGGYPPGAAMPVEGPVVDYRLEIIGKSGRTLYGEAEPKAFGRSSRPGPGKKSGR
jgi:hypothetical protein